MSGDLLSRHPAGFLSGWFFYRGEKMADGKILMIDNYDSFTYNLVQFLGMLGADLVVYRNDHTCLEEVEKLEPAGIVISPGPKTPRDAGLSKDIILEFGPHIPLLGVCLGHQCIGEAYGGNVDRAPYVMHGKTSQVYHDGKGIFKGLPNPIESARYHSLAVLEDDLPSCLEVSARTEDGLIMGVRHKDYPIEGIQFHPESFMTPEGLQLLDNFLEVCA
jgi:anthranilate synthase/aminodeoxychorismate synthase-like glutamine amidotransferase